jgi:transposase
MVSLILGQNMSESDGRYLSQPIQEYLRHQAVRLRAENKAMAEIANFLGVHRNTVSRWCQIYAEKGEAGLSQSVRGRPVGNGRHLSGIEEITIPDLILAHFPVHYGIDSALWTRRAVQTLIEQECGFEMPIRTVGTYLKRWGMTPQRPLKRAYEQDPKAVAAWVEVEYPALEARVAAVGGEIAWGDESGLRSTDHCGRGYAPIGETPEIDLSQKNRYRVNFIASIDNQGLIRFMLYREMFTGLVFITFLQRLIQGRKRKLFWIVDRHPVHRAGIVKQWLAKHTDQIELVFLPAYSPHLNPVEYLNGDVKQGVHSKSPSRTQAQLEKRLRHHLRQLQKLSAKAKRFFLHPKIAYAA